MCGTGKMFKASHQRDFDANKVCSAKTEAKRKVKKAIKKAAKKAKAAKAPVKKSKKVVK